MRIITWSTYASFNGDSLPAAFGYSSALVNSQGYARSNRVDVITDETTRAGNNSGTPGYGYLSDTRSRGYDPNGSRTVLHFSSG